MKSDDIMYKLTPRTHTHTHLSDPAVTLASVGVEDLSLV